MPNPPESNDTAPTEDTTENSAADTAAVEQPVGGEDDTAAEPDAAMHDEATPAADGEASDDEAAGEEAAGEAIVEDAADLEAPDIEATATDADTEAETAAEADDVTEKIATEEIVAEAVTEKFSAETVEEAASADTADEEPERRFTAPGFDAGSTEIMPTMSDDATEVIAQPDGDGESAEAQRSGLSSRLPAVVSRSWGWTLALVGIIVLLAVVGVLLTLWLTRDSREAASQEDRVRETIGNFDVAIQTGDLAALRSLTCGEFRDRYVNYDQKAWDETYRRVAAAKQYPVVASIDQVVVNDGHAEANVTAFMASEPRVRSTRSFDLQFRDDQWKICQTHGS